jgi:hypothetical protein
MPPCSRTNALSTTNGSAGVSPNSKLSCAPKAIRTIDALCRAIGEICDLFSPQEGIVRLNSILPARAPRWAGVPLFLLTNCRRTRPVSGAILGGSDSLLVHAPGTARPMTSWLLAPVCCSKGDENISVMVTHAKPKRRERPTGRRGLDGHGGQPAADFLSGMRYAVKIASQRLLANASGSVRSGSTGHH